jgi:hypothetical protein
MQYANVGIELGTNPLGMLHAFLPHHGPDVATSSETGTSAATKGMTAAELAYLTKTGVLHHMEHAQHLLMNLKKAGLGAGEMFLQFGNGMAGVEGSIARSALVGLFKNNPGLVTKFMTKGLAKASLRSAAQLLKFTGKQYVHAVAGKAALPGWAGAGFYGLIKGYQDMMHQSVGIAGEEASGARNAGNYTASVGATLFDIIDEWATFGLMGKGAEAVGLTLPGLNGQDTQTLRGLYWSSHPSEDQNNVSNEQLIRWVVANKPNFSSSLSEITNRVAKYAK